MKHISLFMLIAVAALVACEKNPDTDKLDNDYLVYTNYDAKADFKTFSTFYVIDSILIISNESTPTYWNNTNSENIINAYTDNLIETGYTEVDNKDGADLVLQISYINSTYYFTQYNNGPWWNNYPGYWNWGGWGWYYPYPITYSFSTGSIIGDLVNQKNKDTENNKLTVVWNSYICGLLNGSNLSLTRTMTAIDQAFEQSPYLKK